MADKIKIVINACFGGFSLSRAAALRIHELDPTLIAHPVVEYFGDDPVEKKPVQERIAEARASSERRGDWGPVFSPDERFVLDQRGYGSLSGKDRWEERDLFRTEPILIRVIEELGEKADGSCASLKVVEVPEGVSWHIEEYDGREHVAENHRTWA